MTRTLEPLRWWDIEELLPIEEQLFGMERWSAGMFWSELAHPDSRHYLVVREDGEILGYGGLCDYGGEAYVQTIGVRPGWHRQGVGSTVLGALLAEADRRKVRMVGLEVRADNAAAQQLYARYGFQPVGVRRGYYQPSNVDAVVMIRQ
jgi:ribosomal-protein-alanine N-acetyltransferase